MLVSDKRTLDFALKVSRGLGCDLGRDVKMFVISVPFYSVF